MFIVGIDVAKRSHEVCMITSDGRTVQRPFSIRNNCTGYNLMLEKIRKHTNIKSQIVFAMESTAHYWLALFTRLRKDGYHVILLNPIQTSAMRDMFIRKIKTDAKDSFIIAELIRFGRYAESNVAQDRLLALKELCRNRFYLVDMAGDLKRKLIALIDRVFPEYEAQFDTIFCKSSVALLKKYPTPQKLSNAHLDKLTELLWNSSNGHFGEWKARELRELARNSFGVEDCDGAYSTLILLMLDQIQSLSGKADALEKKYPDCFRALIRRSRLFPALDRSLEPSFSAKSEISPVFFCGQARSLYWRRSVCQPVRRVPGCARAYVQTGLSVSAQMHLDGVSGRCTARSHVPRVLRKESRRRAQIHDDHRSCDEENDRRGICHSA